MEERLWHKSYAPGVPKTIAYEKVTVPQALQRTADRFPGHTALNYMGALMTYSELNAKVNAFARALLDLGIKTGDKVAVCLPNIPQVVIATMAIQRIGAVVVQNNPLYTERELAYQLDDSEARMIVTLTLLVPRIENIRAQTGIEKIIACHIHSFLPFPKKQLFPLVKRKMYRRVADTEDVKVFDRLIAEYSSDPVEDLSLWNEVSTLLYTGGTTGVSKGVELTHANLSVNVQQFAAWFPDLSPGQETLVGNFPIFHTAGNIVQSLITWQGWTNILVPRPEPKINIEIVKKYSPTFLPGVPTIFVGLLAEPTFRRLDFSSLKGFFSGAAPLAADTIRDLKELSGAYICEVYGCTETAPVVTITPWGGTIKPGTVGLPVPDTDVKIVAVDDPEIEMPRGEAGEIAVKGPQVMRGYHKKPEETAAALKDG